MNLKDDDLREFVKNKETKKFKRDERAAEREVRKIEKEIELETIKRERQSYRDMKTQK